MNQDLPIRGLGSTPGPQTPDSAGSPRAEGGPAFRALLDELQEKARLLKQDGEALSQPGDLAGAVDRARASIDDAFSLGDQLLEAYRAAQQVDDTSREKGSDGRQNA